MASSNPSRYLEALRDQLKTALSLKDSKIHGGQFNLNEVKRVATKAPSAFVSLLDLPVTNAKNTCGGKHRISPVIFLFTQGKDRATNVIDLATQATQWLTDNQINVGFNVTAPKNVIAKNMYTEAIDQMGINAWVISFTVIV